MPAEDDRPAACRVSYIRPLDVLAHQRDEETLVTVLEIAFGPFLEALNVRLDQMSEQELREAIRALAGDLRPAERASFLSRRSRRDTRQVVPDGLLGDIEDLLSRIRAGEFYDGWGWDDSILSPLHLLRGQDQPSDARGGQGTSRPWPPSSHHFLRTRSLPRAANYAMPGTAWRARRTAPSAAATNDPTRQACRGRWCG